MRDFRLSKNFKIVLNDTADLEQTELHSNSFQLLKIAAMLRLAASEVADCGGIEEQLPMLCQCCANACSVCAGALCVCVCQDMFKSRPCHFFVSCKSASMLNTNGFQTLSIAALRQRRRHLLPTRFSGYDLSNCFGSCHSVWHCAGFQG